MVLYDTSGGELQRFAIAMVAVQNADVYMFDEPSSYLDVRQRLKAAQVIRSLTGRSEEEAADERPAAGAAPAPSAAGGAGSGRSTRRTVDSGVT